MTGFHIEPEALIEFGKGSVTLGEKFATLAGLLEHARTDDNAFGPIGKPLGHWYYNALDECKKLTEDAKGFCEHTADVLTANYTLYTGTETGIGDAFDQMQQGLAGGGGGPGLPSASAVTGGSDLAHATGAEGKNPYAQAAGRGSSIVGAGQALADASDPPAVASATVSARWEYLQAVANPGKALMSNGVGFLVSIALTPVVELCEFLIADPPQLRAVGNAWEQTAAWLDHVAESEKRRGAATEPSWEGDAGDAFRGQIGEFGLGVTALAQDVRELKRLVDLVADLFDMVVEFLIQMLTEFVIGLIVQWLAALAASWITAGASVATASATTTVQTGVTVGRVAQTIRKVQATLFKLMQQLEKLLVKLRGPLRNVINRMNARRGGGRVDQFVGRFLDRRSGPGSLLTRARTNVGPDSTINGVAHNVDDLASTTGNRFMSGTTGSEALAGNIAQQVLGRTFGGATTWGQAASNAGMRVGADAAVQIGADMAYDTGVDAATGAQSEEERRETQDRGFSW